MQLFPFPNEELHLIIYKQNHILFPDYTPQMHYSVKTADMCY